MWYAMSFFVYLQLMSLLGIEAPDSLLEKDPSLRDRPFYLYAKNKFLILLET